MTVAPSPRPIADAGAPDVNDAASLGQGVTTKCEQLGRYLLFPAFARGGMATVHLGVNVGPSGFRKVFAVKKLLPGLTEDPQLARALVLEAKLSSFVRSPHVTSTHEVAAFGEELALVMELVDGVTLAKLLACARAADAQVPLPIVSRILGDVLRGLQAVHDATDETGRPLQMVHRDVAPKNVLVGRDGLTRIVDFGLAKVVGQKGLTRTGEIKGTLAYMAPEQTEPGRTVTRRTDLYAAGLTAWEMLTGARYFADAHGAVGAARARAPEPPSRLRGDVPPGLDQLVLRALATAPSERPATAEEMLIALEVNVPPATVEEVARFVERVAWEQLEAMTERIRAALAAPVAPTATVASAPAPTSAPTTASTSAEPSVAGTARSRKRWVLVGAASATLVFLAVALAFSSPSASVILAAPSPSSRDSAESSRSPPAPLPPAPLPPTLAAEVAVDAGQGPTPPVNEVKPGASGKPTSPTSPTVRRPRKERRNEPRRATICNPPYEYDSEMRKRFKPECVE